MKDELLLTHRVTEDNILIQQAWSLGVPMTKLALLTDL